MRTRAGASFALLLLLSACGQKATPANQAANADADAMSAPPASSGSAGQAPAPPAPVKLTDHQLFELSMQCATTYSTLAALAKSGGNASAENEYNRRGFVYTGDAGIYYAIENDRKLPDDVITKYISGIGDAIDFSRKHEPECDADYKNRVLVEAEKAKSSH